MRIVAPVYENFTMLDLVGPLEVLSMLPDCEILVAGVNKGVVWPDMGVFPIVAPYAIGEIEQADLLLVPGGTGTVAALQDARLVEGIGRLATSAQRICSVCTGSLLLGAASLLEGKRATTHWMMLDALAQYKAVPASERWIEDGKVLTAAGVSAGIDMALYLAAALAGEDTARAIQLALEYSPAPPFGTVSPQTNGALLLGQIGRGAVLMDRSSRSRPNILDPLTRSASTES
jgi:transcriptional regulator GlxA family with amidase domain